MNNEKSSKWVELEWDKFKIKRVEMVRGSEVELFVSPYNIPKAFRSVLNEEHKKFTIEFKYLDDEPSEVRNFNEYTKISLGKNSNRLYSIELDLLKMEKAKLKHNYTNSELFSNVLNTLIRESTQRHHSHLKDNYELAKDAFKVKETEVFAAI